MFKKEKKRTNILISSEEQQKTIAEPWIQYRLWTVSVAQRLNGSRNNNDCKFANSFMYCVRATFMQFIS